MDNVTKNVIFDVNNVNSKLNGKQLEAIATKRFILDHFSAHSTN